MTLSLDRRQLIAGSLALGSSGLLATPSIAQTPTRMKMVLNWRYQGPQSWFFIAQDRGYFKEAGIEMEIDQGEARAPQWGRSHPVLTTAASAISMR